VTGLEGIATVEWSAFHEESAEGFFAH
jgi:hypothetical protein